jgi:hypothetical protein
MASNWIISVRGNIYDKSRCSYEVSVIDTDNHGIGSWGWHDENKIAITSSELVNCQLNPRTPGQIERVLKIAQVLCGVLNTIDLDKIPLRPELLPTKERNDEKV